MLCFVGKGFLERGGGGYTGHGNVLRACSQDWYDVERKWGTHRKITTTNIPTPVLTLLLRKFVPLYSKSFVPQTWVQFSRDQRRNQNNKESKSFQHTKIKDTTPSIEMKNRQKYTKATHTKKGRQIPPCRRWYVFCRGGARCPA